MEDSLTVQLTPAAMLLIPMVAGIVQILKRIKAVEKIKGWLPFVSMGIALGLGYLQQVDNPVMTALIVGLVASGGYDAIKNRIT